MVTCTRFKVHVEVVLRGQNGTVREGFPYPMRFVLATRASLSVVDPRTGQSGEPSDCHVPNLVPNLAPSSAYWGRGVSASLLVSA